MENKLILAFYLPSQTIHDIDDFGHKEQLTEYLTSIMGEDNLPVIFYLPTDGDIRVECINPVVLNEEQFKEYDEIITAVKGSEKFKNLKGEQTDN